MGMIKPSIHAFGKDLVRKIVSYKCNNGFYNKSIPYFRTLFGISSRYDAFPDLLSRITVTSFSLGLALLTLSWDKNWDSHSLVNGYPSLYPRIAFVAPSPGDTSTKLGIVPCSALYGRQGVRSIAKHREFGITNRKASAQSSLQMFFFFSPPQMDLGSESIRSESL